MQFTKITILCYFKRQSNHDLGKNSGRKILGDFFKLKY